VELSVPAEIDDFKSDIRNSVSRKPREAKILRVKLGANVPNTIMLQF
jgi:hypothetical protein